MGEYAGEIGMLPIDGATVSYGQKTETGNKASRL
jgi:hypothetical protein